MKNKRAMTLSTIAKLVLLVLAFLLILAFLLGSNPYDLVDKEKCHKSVVYKATVPEVGDIKAVDIPLDCTTERLCIVKGDLSLDDCEKDYEGGEYQKVEIGYDEDKWDENVNAIIAEKLYECWWMMGRGELKLYSRDPIKDKRYCNICTRIAFGEKLKEDLEEREDVEKRTYTQTGKDIWGTQKYLTLNYHPGSDETYWQYITNSNSNFIYGWNESEDYITTKQKAIVFMESDRTSFLRWVGFIGGGVVGGVLGVAVGPLGAVGAGIGGAIGKDLGVKADEWFTKGISRVSSMSLVDYDYNNLKNENCTSFKESF